MSKKTAKRRTRADLRIAARAMTSEHNVVQLPRYARELWRPHRYKVLWGGRGGARSWSVARALLLIASQRKRRVLCAREMQSSIKDSVHQLLRDQIDLMGLKGFSVTDREITHRNGSLFIFTGLRHNLTKVKSLEGIDVCWVEEAERISKESWSILVPTIRKSGSEIWVTFNPDQESDATYARFILHPPEGTWALKVGWEDNAWLSDELRDEKDYAYATDPESADHVWGGNIRRVSAAQIMAGKYRVEEFVVPRDSDGNPLWDGPYQGVDFGYGVDPAAGVRLWIHNRTLYVEYEMWKLKLDIDDMPQQLQDDIPGFSDYVARADSSRPDSISYLKRHGVPQCKPAKKHAGSVKEGIAHLRSYEMIIVHPRCAHFQNECKFYSFKVDARSGDVLPIIVDKHNHLLDSARYALDPIIQQRALKVGVLLYDDQKVLVCPECESLVPDEGICLHCGFNTHDVVEPDGVSDVILAEVEEPRIDHRHANGNGNGTRHSNGNGKTALASRLAAFGSMND